MKKEKDVKKNSTPWTPKKGDHVWVPKRGSDSYGQIESFEGRPDGKMEYTILKPNGGRITALSDDIEELK